MPQVPPLSLPGATVEIEDLYADGLFDPSTNASMEMLNGGLAAGNMKGESGDITPMVMQLGSFAQGYYYGFDRLEYLYGYQTGSAVDGDVLSQRVPHAGFSTKVFIPFTPSAVLYGFQGWFLHDAVKHDTGAPVIANERWDWRFKLQSMTGVFENPSKVLYGRLTWGTTSDGFMPENQWRYVHKSGMINTGLSKGYFSIEFSMSGALKKDNTDFKCKTASGGVWILALR